MKEVSNGIADFVITKHRHNQQPIKDVRFLFVDFTKLHILRLEFECCEFHECIFGDVSFCKFTKCFFTPKTKLSNAPRFQQETKFTLCNLEEFDFSSVNLEHFKFKDCKLTNARFENSHLSCLSFGECDMQLIDFSKTTLYLLSFLSCNLEGCIFNEEKGKLINDNTIINCNLSFVKILNSAINKETLSRQMNNTHYLELVV